MRNQKTSLDLILPVGTQVVVRPRVEIASIVDRHIQGTVAEIISVPIDAKEPYRLRFAEGSEGSLTRTQFTILKHVKNGPLGKPHEAQSMKNLDQYVIYRCVVGSQAYGLSREGSDVDRRGIFLPPAALEWSIYGVPEQLENPEAEECYWELKKFLVLALKANPNILECLFTPIVEQSSEIADAVLEKRSIFLSKLVYQTYNGYVMSQFKRLEQDLRNKGEPKWKHAMHLLRLLLQGISVLEEARVPVRISQYRDALLSVRDGKESWSDVNAWRLSLHREFDRAFQETSLPEAPDYEEANQLLVWARSKMVEVAV